MYRNETCQICGVMGHIVKIYWHLSKHSQNQDELSKALPTLTLDNTVFDTEWTLDTGASHYMTGTTLPIPHNNSSLLSSGTCDASLPSHELQHLGASPEAITEPAPSIINTSSPSTLTQEDSAAMTASPYVQADSATMTVTPYAQEDSESISTLPFS
ncbi:hypothetical protein LWI29_016823 [Acer saccharum]|uniref:Uncharacterized protein n=1 Tax=Acer saccharum TaxID=4024 RepID=A0AA39S5P8_ACESA|nr:hypothetical protein LWI29_016823 [Acer saccharum]